MGTMPAARPCSPTSAKLQPSPGWTGATGGWAWPENPTGQVGLGRRRPDRVYPDRDRRYDVRAIRGVRRLDGHGECRDRGDGVQGARAAPGGIPAGCVHDDDGLGFRQPGGHLPVTNGSCGQIEAMLVYTRRRTPGKTPVPPTRTAPRSATTRRGTWSCWRAGVLRGLHPEPAADVPVAVRALARRVP